MKGIISRGLSRRTTRCRGGLHWLLEPERVPDAVNDVADETCRFAVVHSIAVDRGQRRRRLDEETATARPYMASLSRKIGKSMNVELNFFLNNRNPIHQKE